MKNYLILSAIFFLTGNFFSASAQKESSRHVFKLGEVKLSPEDSVFIYSMKPGENPYPLTPGEIDSLLSQKNKIIHTYSGRKFSELSLPEKDSLFIAMGEKAVLTYAPDYYRGEKAVFKPKVKYLETGERSYATRPIANVLFSLGDKDRDRERWYRVLVVTFFTENQELIRICSGHDRTIDFTKIADPDSIPQLHFGDGWERPLIRDSVIVQ
ncbi:MAG: hypothetical protein COC06_05420 [Bacteroidales bacterium]|nr:MAG: hypothetical protein COC06_05420 [Bacteroidales bacterium]